MNCIYCGSEIPDRSEKCPECGKELPVSEKRNHAFPVAWIVAGIVFCVILIAFLFFSKKSKEQDQNHEMNTTAATEQQENIEANELPSGVMSRDSYTGTDDELRNNASAVIASWGDQNLTNQQLQVFYWMQYYNFIENYGAYASFFGLDMNAPLDAQKDQSGKTWQQTFLERALDNWHCYTALSVEAEKNDFDGGQAMEDYFAQLLPAFEQTAAENGLDSVEDLLRQDMGVLCTYEDYDYYLRNYYLGGQYFASVYESLMPTEEEVESYFAENEESYALGGVTRNTKVVDIRHILVCPEGGTTDENGKTVYSETEWETCRQKANDILTAWLAGEATEDSFAALANEKSEDPGSNTSGGLYEDVEPGVMVQPFNDWCFDDAREIGDYGIVETSYGCHVMYFSGFEYTWRKTAEMDLVSEKASEMLDTIMNQHPLEIDYSKIVLGLPVE